MRISASLIVRNEEKTIEKCLSSINPFVDEIVIVDTGSQDKTIDIAKKFTDKIFKFKWNYDFAEARNFSLSKCTGDWIISIDADEVFHCMVDLRAFLSSLPDNIGAIDVPIFSQIGESILSSNLPRIFRRGAYFSNKIHETVLKSIVERGLEILHTDRMYLIHFGYGTSAREVYEKRRRNLQMLKKAIQKEPDNQVYQFYLAEGVLLGAYKSSNQEYAKKILEDIVSKPSNDLIAIEALKCLIKYSFMTEPKNAKKYIEKLKGYLSAEAEIYEGILAYFEKDWITAFNLLKKYVTRISEFDIGGMAIQSALNSMMFEDGISMFKYIPIKTPNAYVYTAMCYKRLGDIATARRLACEALNFNPLNPLAVSFVNLIDEEMFEDRPYKVLLVSPVRQDFKTLKIVLDSWKNLNLGSCSMDFFFIDNNDIPESSKLLEDFDRNKVIIKDKPAIPYVKSNIHHWNYFLVEKVAKYKNAGINFALSHGYDYVFFVDSDLELHPNTFLNLLKANKPIISGVFWTEAVGLYYPQVWLQDQISCYQIWGKTAEDITGEYKIAYKNTFYEVLKRENIPIRVGGLGACTLVKREPLEKGLNFNPIYNISFFGEDRWFCIRAVALGYDLWAHPCLDAPIIHHYV